MHSLIIGQTESGKSCFSKILANQYKAAGKKVAVLDPICDPDWRADFRTDSVELLKQYLNQNRSVYVFIDESGEVFNEGNDTSYSWLATRSRHYGHSVHFLAQRAIQIPKTMRDQCSRLFLFTSSKSDGKIHSEEWNKDELINCNTLPKLHFYMTDRFSEVKTLKIVDYKKVVTIGITNSNTIESNRISNDTNSDRPMDKRKGKK